MRHHKVSYLKAKLMQLQGSHRVGNTNNMSPYLASNCTDRISPLIENLEPSLNLQFAEEDSNR